MATWTDNYGNEYVNPYVPEKVVGFSGIDPALATSGTTGQGWMADYQNYISNHGSGASEEPDDDIIPISHEKLDDLTGGDTTGHYHLTQAEYEALARLLETQEDEEDSTALTEDEYTKLMLVVEALGEYEDTVAILTLNEYNRLMQMLEDRNPSDEGSEPVFFSEDEYNKVTAILNAAYPNDSTEPVFVNNDTLNSLVDTRIQQNAETLINERIQQETSSIVDTHIQKALDDLSYEDLIDVEALNSTIDTRIQQYLTANPQTMDAETLNSTIDARIAAYLTDNPPEPAAIDVDTINSVVDTRIAAYLAEHPQTTDTDTLNSAIDARVSSSETINNVIDTRIQQALSNLDSGEVKP